MSASADSVEIASHFLLSLFLFATVFSSFLWVVFVQRTLLAFVSKWFALFPYSFTHREKAISIVVVLHNNLCAVLYCIHYFVCVASCNFIYFVDFYSQFFMFWFGCLFPFLFWYKVYLVSSKYIVVLVFFIFGSARFEENLPFSFFVRQKNFVFIWK